jgi:hypothetical protein
MKRLIFFFKSILITNLLLGQAGELIPVKLVAPAQPMFLRDYFTTPVKNAGESGIGGSQFVFDDWLLARIRFMDDKVADSVRIKLNAKNQTIHYINESGEEYQAVGKIKEVKITDNSSTWNNTIFLSGFESDKKSFFQVVSDGKRMMLLKKTIVRLWETKAMFEEAKKEYQKEDEFYFCTKSLFLYKQNKSCSEIQEALRGNEAAIKFITDNSIRCNKEADMKRLVEFVNAN